MPSTKAPHATVPNNGNILIPPKNYKILKALLLV